MKKLLTILFVLSCFVGYSQEFDFYTRGAFYKRMSVYDSTAVADSIAASRLALTWQQTLINGSALSQSNTSDLAGNTFTFQDVGATPLQINKTVFYSQVSDGIGRATVEGSGSPGDGYMFLLDAYDGSNVISLTGDAATKSITEVSGISTLLFNDNTFSLNNGGISDLFIINSAPAQEQTFMLSRSSENTDGVSYMGTYSNSSGGYRFYNYTTNGSNIVTLIGDASNNTIDVGARLVLENVTSGISTDSVLVQNPSNKIVYRRAASSFGNAGTVTNVSALTLGTTGTDLTSSVANSTTTPVITLNVPTASASNRGALSSTDWSTFNSKESALTFILGLNRTVNTIKVDTADASILSRQRAAATYAPINITGTVTSVARTNGLGITASVANPTTTPNITIAVDTSDASILSRQRAALTYAPISINGTVTSVATGLGLSGGTITTSGTLLVDTSSASILSRQRAAATYAPISGGAYLPLAGGTMTGSILFTDNTYDIGASGATRPRTAYFGTSLITPLLLGGTGTTSSLLIQPTSGVGTTGADITVKVGNNGDTRVLKIQNNSWTGFGLANPTNLFSINPVQYNTGTAQQTTTAVVGSGTTFTAAMVGSQFTYADGTNSGAITAFTDATHVTVTTSQTVASQAYTISYTGMQVTTSGSAGFGITSPQAKFHAHSPDGLLMPFGASGTTKGVRFINGASYLSIQGVDNTLGASYQPLAIGGLSLRFESNGATLAAQIDASQRMSIGVSTTPSAYLTLRNGTATAGFAPLKLTITSAIINTVAERGAVEVASNRLYYTDSTGTRYIIHAGGTPTIAAGVGAGTTPTISITGIDETGYVSVTTGTVPTLGAVVATITFSSAYGATPKCVILTPANANTALLTGVTMVYVDQAGISTTAWAITAGATALTAATAYKWYYRILQ